MGANEKPAATFHPDAMLLTAPVVGRCPMDAGLLMRTIDGEIHCRNADCPDYLAVTKLLTDVELEHIVRIEETRFHVKHPLSERVEDAMLSCDFHAALADVGGPPAITGTYRVTRRAGIESPIFSFEAVS